VIVQRTMGYAAARRELKHLYRTVVGDPSSGFTDLLDLQHGGDLSTLMASVLGDGPSTPSAPPNTDSPTQADAPAVRDPDAPAVRRRGAQISPPPTGHQTLDHTNTDGVWKRDAPIEPTEVLPPAAVAPQQVATPVAPPAPNDAPSQPEEHTMPVVPPFFSPPSHEAVASAVDIPTPVDEERCVTDVDVVASEPPAPAKPANLSRVRLVMNVAVGAALLFAGVFLASTWIAVSNRETEEQPVVASTELDPDPVQKDHATRDQPELELRAEQGNLAEPESVPQSEPEPPPAAPETASTTEPDESSTVPLDPNPVADPAADPAPDAEAKPKSEPKPKPKPKPAVDVIFSIPGTTSAEIQVGKRSITYNGYARISLRPGTYSITWRTSAKDKWRSPGTLEVAENLAEGTFYSVKLGTSDIVTTTQKKGSAK
jgi:hypothetical protein